MTKYSALLEQFERAVTRLEEVLSAPKTDIVRDSAIQRFEFSVDLCWKTLKAYLEDKKGLVCSAPKECFREAYRQNIISYDEDWIKFVELRNETSHTYKEELAEKVFTELPNALRHFKELLTILKE